MRDKFTGNVMEVSDISIIRSLEDNKKREPRQVVKILLNSLSKEEFKKLAFAEKVEIKICGEGR